MANPFPDIYPSLEYFWEPEADQTVIDLANKSRQVHQHSPLDRRRFTLRYGMEDDATMWQVLYPHYDARKGETFTFFDFWRIPWARSIHVATGNGTTRRFTLPAKECVGVAAKVGTTTTPVTLFSGTGVEGADEIEFTSAPASSADITFTANYARRRFTVWYDGGANQAATVKPVPVEGGLWGVEIHLIEEIGS